MTRRALSYDDSLEAPMATPPDDISINNLWRRPVIPGRRFTHLAEEDECVSHAMVPDSAPSRSPAVVKAKAASIIGNSLLTKQTQDIMSTFEQRAGLSDTSYTPHKGLTAEETRHHRRTPESLQKLQIQSESAAQSTPSSTPSSPRSSGFSSSVDTGGGGAVERWSIFGPRPIVQKSTSDLGSDPTAAGFALQTYSGAQRPTPTEVMKAQGARLADNLTSQVVAPPKMEIPTVEGRRKGAQPHKLKPRDMNILTPTSF
ncbi:putative monooxygenase p33MONOX [Brachionichthys hirsutus]|uniref:putative monooxygenase p33MONOX n=1 Tax=Brachionichthys hirsutus TaxID=412623 RepID=UPI0036051FD1